MKNKINNIGVIIRSLETGGAEKQSVLLAKFLEGEYNVHLIVQLDRNIDNKLLKLIENTNVHVLYLKGNLLKNTIKLIRYIREYQINMLFAYLLRDNVLAALVSQFIKGVIVVGGIRNCFLPKRKLQVNRLLHRVSHTKTIINNFNGRDYLVNEKAFAGEKCVVIPNTLEEEIELFIREDQNKEIVILTVGRFVEQKDYNTALLSIKELCNKNQKNFKYVIVGYGQLESVIRKNIDDLGLSSIVDIKINPPNISEIYRRADIYLCTSLFEGQSNTIMEAMNFSLPIVATNVGDNNLLVEDEVNGFIVQKRDYKEIALKLNDLVNSYAKRVSFGKKSNSAIHENFSSTSFSNRYKQLINELEC